MGAMTRTLMKDEVETILTRADLTTQIETRLDWAYEIVADAKNWKVLETEDKTTTLVTDTQDYALPSTLRTAEYVVMVDDSGSDNVFYKVDPEDLEQFIENGRNRNEVTGIPNTWTIVNNQIRLSPIPDSTANGFKLYIIGKGIISYFSGDSSTTVLDRKLDRAVIYKAAELSYNDLLEEGQEAQRYRDLAEDAINDTYMDELAYSQI